MIKKKIMDILNEYLEAPEAWSDNVMIEVDPGTLDCRLFDGEDTDLESSDKDYWEVMDLLSMSVSNPGEWEIDPAAVEEMASEYE